MNIGNEFWMLLEWLSWVLVLRSPAQRTSQAQEWQGIPSILSYSVLHAFNQVSRTPIRNLMLEEFGQNGKSCFLEMMSPPIQISSRCWETVLVIRQSSRQMTSTMKMGGSFVDCNSVTVTMVELFLEIDYEKRSEFLLPEFSINCFESVHSNPLGGQKTNNFSTLGMNHTVH